MERLYRALPESLRKKQRKLVIGNDIQPEQVWTQLDSMNKMFEKLFINEFARIKLDSKTKLKNDSQRETLEPGIHDDSWDDSDEHASDENTSDEHASDEFPDEEHEDEIEGDSDEGELSEFDEMIDDQPYDSQDDSGDEGKNADYDPLLEFRRNMNDEESQQENLSTFEKRQAERRAEIRRIEEEITAPKSWELRGEVENFRRPTNSLLEQDIDYDFRSRPAPDITPDVTNAIEEVIKQRIKDKVWDDVERKSKPVKLPAEYKRRLESDHNKSKDGLAAIYEKEFTKKKEGEIENKDQNPEHEEIKKMMRILFAQLDALSAL